MPNTNSTEKWSELRCSGRIGSSVFTIILQTLEYKMLYCVVTVRRVWRYQRSIRIRKSKKDRQYNSQKKKDKQLSTTHTHKTKDRVTRTPLRTVDKYYFNLTCFPLLQMLLSFMYFASILGHACMPLQKAKQDKLHSNLNSSRASSRITSRMITPNHLSQGILSTDFTSTYH